MSSIVHETPSVRPALRVLHDEEAPSYDGGAAPTRRHMTVISDEARAKASALGMAAAGLYLELEGRCNSAGECWPSIATLAEAFGCSDRHVQAALTKLKSAGLVEVVERFGPGRLQLGNAYRLPMHRVPENPSNLRGEVNMKRLHPSGNEKNPQNSSDLRGEPTGEVSCARQEERSSSEVANESCGTPRATSQPYRLFQVLCEETNADEAAAAPSFRSKQLGIAKQILADGFDEEDVRRCIGYLRSQHWRSGLLDLMTVKGEIGRWSLNGKPQVEVSRVVDRSRSNGRHTGGISPEQLDRLDAIARGERR